jgi:hypothetical protein
MSTHRALTSTYSREFTYTRDFGRGCWIIWRHGQKYGEIPRSVAHPANTQTYVERAVRMLNGEQA